MKGRGLPGRGPSRSKGVELAGHQWLIPIILATQEDLGSKPAQANSSKTLSGKNSSQKRASGVAHGIVPKFKPQYREKKKDVQLQKQTSRQEAAGGRTRLSYAPVSTACTGAGPNLEDQGVVSQTAV
jgi:hypothetical protein